MICNLLKYIFKNKHLAYIILLLFAVNSSLYGQNLRTLSTKNGLPQSFVSGLVQDNDGFIWIGTRNGLARYDGRDFKVYQNKYNDENSLASNIVIGIKKQDNDLWVEYESGEVDILDVKTEKIRHFINPEMYKDASLRFFRRGWIVGSGNVFWSISLSGGVTMVKSSDKVKRYTKNSFDGQAIRGLLEDNKQQLWVLGQESLYKFNNDSKCFETVLKLGLNLEGSGSSGEVLGMLQRPDGTIVWADRLAMYFYNPLTGQLKKVKLLSNSPLGVKWIATAPNKSVFFEANGSIYNYDDIKGMQFIKTLKIEDKSFAGCFLIDKSGMLWVGTNAAGIYLLDFSAYFKTFTYTKNFAEDVLQQEFNLSAEKHFNWEKGNEELSSSGYHIRSAYDKSGRLWITLKQTVLCYDTLKKTYIKLPAIPVYGRNLEKYRPLLKGITFTKQGVPVVADYNSNIFIYDAKNKEWDLLLTPFFIRNLYKRPVLTEDIFIDDDKLWITTEGDGLLWIDMVSKKLHQLKKGFPTTHLLGIKKDTKHDFLWIGSYHGLIRFDTKKFLIKVFSVSEGLPDNTIYSILSDRYNYLWLSTNKGLCRFDAQTHKTRNFTFEYGLQGNEFNRFHHLKLPDGQLIFGGLDGWSKFNPEAIEEDTFDTPVAITGLKINNRRFVSSEYGLEPVAINALQSVILPYNDNSFTFEFAGLQYNHPEDIVYRYRLDGFDNNWIVTGNNNEAFYTRIPPGKYTLRVNASNTTGKWSNNYKILQVVINPPWWATWWSYILYGCVAVLLVYLYMRYRINQVVVRQGILLKEKEANQLRELDEMKTRFFANITHELRTPLTLILGPAERLSGTIQDTEGRKLLATINKNGEQLLGLTNQLLDMAKLEAGAMKPHLQHGNISHTIQAVIDLFNEARQKNIQLNFIKPNDNNFNYLYSVYMLERILQNLIANAIKFTQQNGRVQVYLDAGNTTVTIQVKDTGAGIPQWQLPYIFNRFYQAENSRDELGSTGTGIGLALVKEFTEVQGGTITAANYNDDSGSGALFTVRLPYVKSSVYNTGTNADAEIANALITNTNKMQPVIVVVEDNEQLAAFIADSLEPHYKIHQARDGEKGLALTLQFMPDLIISDVVMPVMNGFTLVQKLKEDIRTSHIPVLLLTAKVDFESKIEGLTYGADDYLTKPFHVAELLLRINNQLQQLARQREFIHQNLKYVNAAPMPVNDSHKEDAFLTEFYKIIEDNLDNALFGVEEIVPLINMSRTSLHRKVKALTSMSTGELIRVYRLKRAAQFLRENYSSSEAAYKAGFNSPAYFTKTFKEYYNVTPKEFTNNTIP